MATMKAARWHAAKDVRIEEVGYLKYNHIRSKVAGLSSEDLWYGLA